LATGSQLVERLAVSNDISNRDAEAVLTTVIGTLSEALAKGHRIELRAFGIFSCRERPARQARNPKTGAAVSVEAKTAVHFKAGKALLQILNGDPGALAAFRDKQAAQRRRRDERQGQLSLF